MPCEARRVVVLTEDVYKRLRERQSPLPEIQQPVQLETSEPTHLDPPQVPTPEPVPSENPTLSVSEPVADNPEPQLPPVKDLLPFDHLPSKYRDLAKDILERFESIAEFAWNQISGQVYVCGVDQGIGIVELLKAICVPFTKTPVPPACSDLLTRLSIKPRNHLINRPKLPPWHPYFKF